jgi:hypothetical protein
LNTDHVQQEGAKRLTSGVSGNHAALLHPKFRFPLALQAFRERGQGGEVDEQG